MSRVLFFQANMCYLQSFRDCRRGLTLTLVMFAEFSPNRRLNLLTPRNLTIIRLDHWL
jgi:hypothetical protein